MKLTSEPETRFRVAAAYLASNLPAESFKAVRKDLLSLLSDDDASVRFAGLSCFGKQKDIAAGAIILELLQCDQLDEQFKVTVMQAMGDLTNNTFQYNLHVWGPDTPGNVHAIEKLKTWLQERVKDDSASELSGSIRSWKQSRRPKRELSA